MKNQIMAFLGIFLLALISRGNTQLDSVTEKPVVMYERSINEKGEIKERGSMPEGIASFDKNDQLAETYLKYADAVLQKKPSVVREFSFDKTTLPYLAQDKFKSASIKLLLIARKGQKTSFLIDIKFDLGDNNFCSYYECLQWEKENDTWKFSSAFY